MARVSVESPQLLLPQKAVNVVGKTLGHYEILEPLGVGGMGEVYLAEDARLGRKVAIKVLPAEFAEIPERLARFEQEARAAAALNHPHIAVVHDVGTETVEGCEVATHFMVQEYLEGDTLREPLRKGALPLRKALDLATEIAEALTAAHSAGIIHRDLKPENIFITREGHAKVLDFGLAKLTEVAVTDSPRDLPTSPTDMTTAVGRVLGTAGYMAPEQVEGREEIDHRADLFAFGCVLYEMASGRQAFTGRNVHDILGRIVDQEPDSLTEIAPRLPVELQWIVKKCLAKDPVDRYQSADELVVDLRTLGKEVEAGTLQSLGEQAAATVAAGGPRRALPLKLAVPAFFVVALVAVVMTMWGVRWALEPAEQAPLRWPVELDGQPSTRGGVAMALSPDGRVLAYAASPDGMYQALYVRRLDQLDSVPFSGTERARGPFFSPDGQWIGFFARNELKKVSISGGNPISLCDAPSLFAGGTWGPDGTIVFTLDGTGLVRVSEDGGDPETLVPMSGGERTPRWPSYLPGGQAVLFVSRGPGASFSEAIIEVVDLRGPVPERKVLHRGGSYPRYLTTGHLVYVVGNTLFGVPFDLDRLEVTGAPAVLAENLAVSATYGHAQFAFSESGTLLYMSGEIETVIPTWVDRLGEATRLPWSPRNYWKPAISPDGTQVAIQYGENENTDIWVHDLSSGGGRRLTLHPANDLWPVWSPDGRHIVFGSDREGRYGLFWREADGRGEAVELTRVDEATGGEVWPNAWSPDGRTLAFVKEEEGERGQNIWTLPLEENGRPGQPVSFIQSPHRERGAAFSPDGRWMAYMSDESGQLEVWVRSFPGGEDKWQISTEGGWLPVWSKNSQELFFRDLDRMMMIRFSTDGDVFRFEAPQPLFEVPMAESLPAAVFDITPDGERFLVLLPQRRADEPTHGHLVLNWFDEVRRLVGAGNR